MHLRVSDVTVSGFGTVPIISLHSIRPVLEDFVHITYNIQYIGRESFIAFWFFDKAWARGETRKKEPSYVKSDQHVNVLKRSL